MRKQYTARDLREIRIVVSEIKRVHSDINRLVETFVRAPRVKEGQILRIIRKHQTRANLLVKILTDAVYEKETGVKVK